ncbi:MAG TPA: cobyrinic acid a,c-diamide synthase [Actinomycetota bacterium]|nr:cobyrinic acid a,c-diamide synthase [Actinomycetota bacterium]
MSRRASLPGAEELFRNTTEKGRPQQAVGESQPAPTTPPPAPVQRPESTNLQVASDPAEARRTAPVSARPRHDEKVTFYCTGEELTRIERARLSLRAEHHLVADRGKIVRAALAEILDDFEARGSNSALVKRLENPSDNI